jgi:hypothetical protein
VGDLDGDGITDLAVGADGDSSGGPQCGAVDVVYMNANGTAKGSTKIASGTNGGPTLATLDFFGSSVTSLGDLDGDGLIDLAVGARGYGTSGTVHLLFLKPGGSDFGDAPDPASETGPGNYNTLVSDNGPSHVIVVGLKLGANVDADAGTLQFAAANADDVNGALPDDEDGLANPPADLALTIGDQPKVNVRVTNTTGTAATLYGWIDYNADGVFDNATERASLTVPTGSSNVTKTLTFATVPSGFTGTTFARFRLSSDEAAANPTGAAIDGEVEDYQATITKPSIGLPDPAKTQKIASGVGGGPTLTGSDYFGNSVASLGDLDGDGVTDLAVGANKDDTGGLERGAVHVLFMNSNGTVKSSQKIASRTGGGPTLGDRDQFGSSVASLGDLDGDGVTDLAVGARYDHSFGTYRGAAYVLLMSNNGTVKSSVKIASGLNGGPTLANGAYFGESVASLGDLDGDGVTDLAVGARHDFIYVFFLNGNGTVKQSQQVLGFAGGSLASLGDLDGDGVTELAVGKSDDGTGGTGRGAVQLLFLNSDGTAKKSVKIASDTNGGPTLANNDRFGSSVASLRDLDGDGVTDLVVGAAGDSIGGLSRGAAYVLFLNSNGTVKSSQKIASGTNGGPTLANADLFGRAVASLGDLDGDGLIDFAVSAPRDDQGGLFQGAIYVMFTKPEAAVTLPGDYNLSGVVDAADYTMWRDTLGSTTDLRANGDKTGASAGKIDQADFDVWKGHFGQLATGAGASGEERGASEEQLRISDVGLRIGQSAGGLTAAIAPGGQSPFSIGANRVKAVVSKMGTDPDTPRPAPTRLQPMLPTAVCPALGVPPNEAAAARHDDALLVWLTSRPGAGPRRDDGLRDTLPADRATDETGERLDAGVDDVFAELAVK